MVYIKGGKSLLSPLTSNILPPQGRPGLKERTNTDFYPKMFLFTIILYVFCTVTDAASVSSGTCSVPNDQQGLVRDMQNQLEKWANQQDRPDPSILIALNLAKDHNLTVITRLVEQIKKTAEAEMTSGKVALYVLALRSSCENPADVSTPEKHVNLVQVLENKTKEEIEHINTIGTPKTTYYQLALDTLALCVEKSPEVEGAAIALAKAVVQFNVNFSVDTGAVASLALFCVYEGRNPSQQSKITETIKTALSIIIGQILDEQQPNGILGNIYSTGLAMQALSVTSEFYSANAWSCQKTLNEVLNKTSEGAFNIPAAASQILPSLLGKTYLDVRGLTCNSDHLDHMDARWEAAFGAWGGSRPSAALGAPPGNEEVQDPAPDQSGPASRDSSATDGVPLDGRVHYRVINQLVGPYFSYSTTVKVPKGSVLLAVLKAAEQFNATEFSFQTEETSWGPMVTSIHGLQANTNEKTYWQFLSDEKPLEQGVGSYKMMKPDENIVAMFSRY